MRQYEVTFVVDPVLPSDEVKSVAKKYANFLEKNGCTIVHKDEIGLRQLAYPINRRNTGLYYCYEYQTETGKVVGDIELQMRRDERIMRFLTVKLDKYGIKYNEDKRNGLIAKVEPVVKEEKEDSRGRRRKFVKKDKPAAEKSTGKETVKEEVVEVVKEAPVVAAPAPEVKEEIAVAKEAVEETAPAAEEVKEEVTAPVVEEIVEETKPAAEEVKEEVSVAPEVEEVEEEEEEIEEIEEIFEDWSEEKNVEVKPDDLKKVEGIGPKIAELLNNAGITTFAQLAKTDAEKIKGILSDAGSRYKMHNPTTWPKQAELAAEGKWDELKKWQDELDGGK